MRDSARGLAHPDTHMVTKHRIGEFDLFGLEKLKALESVLLQIRFRVVGTLRSRPTEASITGQSYSVVLFKATILLVPILEANVSIDSIRRRLLDSLVPQYAKLLLSFRDRPNSAFSKALGAFHHWATNKTLHTPELGVPDHGI